MSVSKPLLYGIGIGLVAASVYLGLYSGEQPIEAENQEIEVGAERSEEQLPEEVWNEELIREIAAEYGLAVYAEEEARYSEAEFQQLRKELSRIPPEEVYIIPIQAGMNLGQVSRMLTFAGLVESEDELIDKMVQKNLQYSIQTGIFRIKAGTDIDEIIQILTGA